ncbi:MAG: hypothetical protein V4592_16355 [Bacteroidota bacterium]
MNRKLTIAALTLLLFSIKAFSQYKVVQKLGNLATIALPDTPNVINKSGNTIYRVQYHGVLFMAHAGDVSGGLRDMFSKDNPDSLYNIYIKGMLGPTKGEVFYKNKIAINGHQGIEFGYKAVINGQLTFSYNHAVTVRDTMLMCGIWSSDSLSKDDKNLTKFFNGFKVKSDEELKNDRASELGHKTGKIIAFIIFISIPILLGLGIVFMIRKVVYRKKNKTDLK